MVTSSQGAPLLSSSTRVLGTKLQERPRAGFNRPVLLSLVTWLVTCRTDTLIMPKEKWCHFCGTQWNTRDRQEMMAKLLLV